MVRTLLISIFFLFRAWIVQPIAHAKIHDPIRKELAIVIDDFGNGMRGTEEILDLPVPITAAVMPFLSTTEGDARTAHDKGHEVIVHLPMQRRERRVGLVLGRLRPI